MALIATSLRIAFRDASHSLQYSFLLFVAALFALVGGHFVGGLAVLPYDLDFGVAVAALLMVLLFSYIFVWFASEISEFLSHRAYLSGEDFLVRGFRVFSMWLFSYLVVFLLYSYLPNPFHGILAFFLTLITVYASVVAAIDGYTVIGAFKESLTVLRGQFAHVAEFAVLSLLVLIPVFLIDLVGGVIATAIFTFIVLPWLTAHAVLTYLYRYPLVVATLSKLEGL